MIMGGPQRIVLNSFIYIESLFSHRAPRVRPTSRPIDVLFIIARPTTTTQLISTREMNSFHCSSLHLNWARDWRASSRRLETAYLQQSDASESRSPVAAAGAPIATDDDDRELRVARPPRLRSIGAARSRVAGSRFPSSARPHASIYRQRTSPQRQWSAARIQCRRRQQPARAPSARPPIEPLESARFHNDNHKCRPTLLIVRPTAIMEPFDFV